MQNTMIDFFAGIGGFTLGFEAAGFRCIGHCEIDRYAQRSYTAIHGDKEGAWFAHDITAVRPEDVPPCDCFTAGFPCQDISVAGRGRGIAGARSSLFFEIIRIIEGKNPCDRPKWVVFENVKNLLSINRGRDFATVLHSLAESGYDVEYQVLNSKHHGVPQNRERVFIVGHFGGRTGKIFPVLGANSKNLIELIGGQQGKRVYDPAGIGVTLTAQGGGMGGRTGLYAVKTTDDTASFIDLTHNSPRLTDTARCIKARYTAGVSNRKGDNSGVVLSGDVNKIRRFLNTNPSGRGMNGNVYSADGIAPSLTTNKGEGLKVAIPIITPDRETKRQNGRRMKEAGEPMFCLTAQDRHGVVLVKEATKQGYAEAGIGDSINFSVPGSKTRRGRVGRGVANTLDTACNQGGFDGCRIRRLTPRECFRLQGISDDLFEKAQAVNSDSQLYKQAGNGVTVNVIYDIASALLEHENGGTK